MEKTKVSNKIIVKEFYNYAEELKNNLSWWDKFISTKFFMFVKFFIVFIISAYIIDGLNWLSFEYHIDEIIYVFLFCATFIPMVYIGSFQSVRGTLLYSPIRKVFFIRRLAVLASRLMLVNAEIAITDKKKQFIAKDISQLEKLFKKRTIFFISGETKSHTRFEATYRMTFTPRGGRIIAGTPVGYGGGDNMYIWEITCVTTLHDCEGSFDYRDGEKKIVIDNVSTTYLSKELFNNKMLLEKIDGTDIRGHFNISDHKLFLTIYDNIKKIKYMPYSELFKGNDKKKAVRQVVSIMDILSGK